jgi:hypothetical protein
MSDLRLRARSVSEIVDAAFQLYRRDAPQYMLVTAIAYAPWLVAQLLLVSAQNNAGALSTTATALGVVLGLGSWLAFSIMSAVIIRFGSEAYLGGRPDLASSVQQVLPRVPVIMAAAILLSFLLLLGFLVFFFGALYVLARYFAIFQAIVLEKAGLGEAFSRSSALSKGRKRHILNTLLLVFLIFFVLSIAVSMVAAMSSSQVIATVLQTLFTIVAYPLIGIAQMLLYYDARIRAEGFDIEVMAGSLQPLGHPEGLAP